VAGVEVVRPVTLAGCVIVNGDELPEHPFTSDTSQVRLDPADTLQIKPSPIYDPLPPLATTFTQVVPPKQVIAPTCVADTSTGLAL
jgi:hypothetical protein